MNLQEINRTHLFYFFGSFQTVDICGFNNNCFFFAKLHIILEYPVFDSPHILLISFSFYFQFDQLGLICTCCLLDDISSTERHKKMKAEAFIHQNQSVSFVDAYSDVNGCPPVSAESICETCTNFLESAYVFRQMCRVANQFVYNVCRCCLQEKSDSNDQFLNMENAVFEHNNKSVTLYEAYFDVNSLEYPATFIYFDFSICKDCALQLESAYAFRRMCQKTAELLQQTPERKQNKESGQECSRLNSAHCISHNTNKKKSRKADKQQAAIKIKTDQRALKSQRSNHIQQISFSFNCKNCPNTFKSKVRLTNHRKIKHRDVRATRDLYARVWKKKSTLRLFGRIKQNFCERCQKVFRTRERHSCHNRPVPQMDCTVLVPQQLDSDKVFNSSPGLKILNKSFLQKIQYRCKKYPQAFQTKHSLGTHVYIEYLNTSYDCKECDKAFNTSASLYQHNLGHGKSLHQCEKCPKAYRRRSNLVRHIQTKHENSRLHCQDCDKVFESYGGLHSHKSVCSLSAHTNAKHSNKTFQCEKCSKIFQRKNNFIVHYRSKHLDILLLACQDCDKVFASKSGLNHHKASKHLKILHQCEQCPKIFSVKQNLRRHVANIHDKKQYSCQDCNKVFKTQNYLTLHKNIIHLKKLLKCKNCEKTFTDYYTRDYHNKREHLKLTVECQKCKKIYVNTKILAVHMQKIHPNDP
jgi:hypothetical protein